MTPYSHLSALVPLRKDLKLRLDGKFGIVSNPNDHSIEYLNETALSIFQLCDGKNNIADIAKVVSKEYEVDSAVLERDLVEIIRDLQWKKLIVLKRDCQSSAV